MKRILHKNLKDSGVDILDTQKKGSWVCAMKPDEKDPVTLAGITVFVISKVILVFKKNKWL